MWFNTIRLTGVARQCFFFKLSDPFFFTRVRQHKYTGMHCSRRLIVQHQIPYLHVVHTSFTLNTTIHQHKIYWQAGRQWRNPPADSIVTHDVQKISWHNGRNIVTHQQVILLHIYRKYRDTLAANIATHLQEISWRTSRQYCHTSTENIVTHQQPLSSHPDCNIVTRRQTTLWHAGRQYCHTST
jgi:hypothetical protein